MTIFDFEIKAIKKRVFINILFFLLQVKDY